MKDITTFIACYSKTNKEWLEETVESIQSQGVEPDVRYEEGLTADKWSDAIQRCKSKYLHLAHHDDTYVDGFYNETTAYLDSHPSAVACFTLDYIINEKGHRVSQTRLPFPPQDSYDYKDVFNLMVRHGNFLRCPSVVLNVPLVKGLRYPPTECGSASDTGFWFRILQRGPIGIINKQLYCYRDHAKSDTKKYMDGKDHVRALKMGLELHPCPTEMDWDVLANVTKAIQGLEDSDEDIRLQGLGKSTERTCLLVAHEPPYNAGTGILVGERAKQINRGGEEIAYYVYPDKDAERFSISTYEGVPTVKCPPYQFGEVCQSLQPDRIEFQHLLGWPLDILSTHKPDGGLEKALYLHDSYLFCPRAHLWNRNNEVCSGPGPDKCTNCSGISPEELQEREETLKSFLPSIDHIYANSEWTASNARRFLPTDKQIEVMEWPIPDHPHYRRRVRIGYFGYFAPVKGINVLMQAMMKVNWGQLLLFCDIPEHFRNGRRIWGHDNTLIIGPYDNRSLPQLCNLCDIGVVPSEVESFGITGRELEALGLPCIKTNVGGQTGEVEGGNVDALAKALQEAVDAYS